MTITLTVATRSLLYYPEQVGSSTQQTHHPPAHYLQRFHSWTSERSYAEAGILSSFLRFLFFFCGWCHFCTWLNSICKRWSKAQHYPHKRVLNSLSAVLAQCSKYIAIPHLTLVYCIQQVHRQQQSSSNCIICSTATWCTSEVLVAVVHVQWVLKPTRVPANSTRHSNAHGTESQLHAWTIWIVTSTVRDHFNPAASV